VSSIRLIPTGLPTALADGHGFQPLENARPRQRDQGEMRMRPRWRTTPERCTVRWRFTQAQFDLFDAWYEDTLRAGTLDFDVPVHRRGQTSGDSSGLTWYTALFEGDYACEVDKTQRYFVSATLQLLDDLGPDRVPPGITSTIALDFGLSAQTLPPLLAATIELNFGLQAVMPSGATGATIELDFGLAWVAGSTPPGASIRETDSGEEREVDSGDTRLTD
jgi:hypothetical protein